MGPQSRHATMSSVPKPGSRPSAVGGQNGWIGTLSTANIGCDRSDAHTTHHRRRESSALRPGQVWVRFIRLFQIMDSDRWSLAIEGQDSAGSRKVATPPAPHLTGN